MGGGLSFGNGGSQKSLFAFSRNSTIVVGDPGSVAASQSSLSPDVMMCFTSCFRHGYSLTAFANFGGRGGGNWITRVVAGWAGWAASLLAWWRSMRAVMTSMSVTSSSSKSAGSFFSTKSTPSVNSVQGESAAAALLAEPTAVPGESVAAAFLAESTASFSSCFKATSSSSVAQSL